MKSHIYIEGGESKEDQVRCREGFRKLFEKAGFSAQRRMPRLSACGSRGSAFDDFKTALKGSTKEDYIGMLVDSEDPVADIEKTWDHLRTRDGWQKPSGSQDEQVLFMTTCMETWIVADRASLKEHYGHKLKENALPPLQNLEQRNRHELHESLVRATGDCSNAYAKGKRSFEALGKLDVEALKSLPSFARILRILGEKL